MEKLDSNNDGMLSFEEFKVLFDNADKRRKLSHASESICAAKRNKLQKTESSKSLGSTDSGPSTSAAEIQSDPSSQVSSSRENLDQVEGSLSRLTLSFRHSDRSRSSSSSAAGRRRKPT